MSCVQFPAVTPKRRAWNKGRIIGQKRPLLPKQVRAIRARLELATNLGALAVFNAAIDGKLRGRDLLKLAVTDIVKNDCVRERVSAIQSKTKRPVQFELTDNMRDKHLAPIQRDLSCAAQKIATGILFDQSSYFKNQKMISRIEIGSDTVGSFSDWKPLFGCI